MKKGWKAVDHVLSIDVDQHDTVNVAHALSGKDRRAAAKVLPVGRRLSHAAVSPAVDVPIPCHKAVVQSTVAINVAEANVCPRNSVGRLLVQADVPKGRGPAAVVDMHVPITELVIQYLAGVKYLNGYYVHIPF